MARTLDCEATASAKEQVRAAQSGDLDAFEALYRENVGRIYALCLRMTADADQAEELTQMAFVRAWRKLATFHGRSRFSTWLHRLTVNLVLGTRRSEARRLRASAANQPGSADLSHDRLRAQPGSRIDLETAIADLPPKARRVFVLHDVEGFRHAEIAEIMGTAAGTSKAQLHRARKILREVLAQ